MRPVNLIPGQSRRQPENEDAGNAPYVVIAVLAVVALAVLGYVLNQNQLVAKRQRLAEVTEQQEQTSKKTAALASYGDFSTVRQQRLAGVMAVTEARFPWADVLDGLAKTLPKDAWLISATGRVSKTAKTGEKGGSASSATNAADISVPGPTLVLVGCTYRQHQLADVISRLRSIPNVAQVLLSSSDEKDEAESVAINSSSDDSDCRTKAGIHKFVITVTFPAGKEAAVVAAGSGSSTTPEPASSGTSPAAPAATGAQPASATGGQ